MNATLIKRSDLCNRDLRAMFGLLESQFEGACFEGFCEDLSNKNWVLIFRDRPGGQVTGFTTIAHYLATFADQRIQVVCSGDTVVSQEVRRQGSLARHWWHAVRQLASRYPGLPLYWLFICSGFRTYRFLTSFAKQHFPSWRWPTPPRIQALMHDLATARFGPQYLPSTGIVRLDRPMRLRDALRGIPDERKRDPDIAYFHRINPGHDEGDELVCLALVDASNLTPLGQRIAGKIDRVASDQIVGQ